MRRRLAAVAAKALVTVLLLAVVFRNVDTGPVVARLLHVHAGWAALAATVLTVQLVLSALRWHAVCRILGTPMSSGRALQLMFIGHFFTQTLPSGMGGDAVRVWLLTRLGIGLRAAVSAVVCDRALALLVLLTLTCAMVPFFLGRVAQPEARLVFPLTAGALLAGVVAFVVLGPAVLSRFVRYRIGEALHRVAGDLRRVVFRPGTPLVVALSLAVQAGLILACFALCRALGAPGELLDFAILVPPIMLAAVLPISIAGWGIRETAMIAGLGLVGIPGDAALAISIAFGLLLLLLAIPGGLLWTGFARRPPARG